MENRIEIENCCYICCNRSFHTDGIYCGLTKFMVDYADYCEDFIMDEAAKTELALNIKNQQIDEQQWESLNDFDKFLLRHTLIGKIMYFDKLSREENKNNDAEGK